MPMIDAASMSPLPPSGVALTHGHDPLIGLLMETAQHQSQNSKRTTKQPSWNYLKQSNSEISCDGSPAAGSDVMTHGTFRDPEVMEYLNSLTALPLSSLLQQPAKLASEMTQIDAQLSELAYKEYKSFLTSSTCEEDVLKGFDSLHQLLGKLDSLFPRLESSCHSFRDTASTSILSNKAMYANLLNKHSKIMDLLEIPHLAETFVRSGYYEEAMDLYIYVIRLASRHPNSLLIKSIAEEAEGIKKTMVAQLFKLLSTNVKLPLCIRVVGYLRRLSVFSEVELRVLFLQQRHEFLSGMLHELNGERDAGEYLRRYIEISREHFFDIIAQYRAIFSDSNSLTTCTSTLSNTIGSPTTPSSPFISFASSSIQSETISDMTASTATILSSYAAHAVANLVNTVSTQLMSIHDTSRLASLLTQCMYYGMSLGRVGVDFRMVVGRLFEDAVLRIVRDEIRNGVDRFERMLAESGEKGLTVKTAIHDGHSTTSIKRTGNTSSVSKTTPPASLMTHPPLAHLINSYFTSYNQLRLLAPLSLTKPITQLLTESLTNCAGVLSKFGDERRSRWSLEERNAHNQVVTARELKSTPLQRTKNSYDATEGNHGEDMNVTPSVEAPENIKPDEADNIPKNDDASFIQNESNVAAHATGCNG
ncbi:hypothetical protein SeMB42_g05559 [Synchytrium endobioticum]|uniref:Conserved oligomeric Golgi complex subunit 8 n=1 Tax=Synchytrium endobioticum TaxID=286115 RepID=A0A507CQQ1_9FUNG|nr:hypothetical protein SeMB42_g05559 [Synchytrium endobioticum]